MVISLFIIQNLFLVYVLLSWYSTNEELARSDAALAEAEAAITVQNANLAVGDELISQMSSQNKVLARRLSMKVVK